MSYFLLIAIGSLFAYKYCCNCMSPSVACLMNMDETSNSHQICLRVAALSCIYIVLIKIFRGSVI